MEKTFRIVSHEEVEVITTIRADSEDEAIGLWRDGAHWGEPVQGDTIDRTIVDVEEVDE